MTEPVSEDKPRPDCPRCKAEGKVSGTIRLGDGKLMCTDCCETIPEEKIDGA
jgi:transposase-like protein